MLLAGEIGDRRPELVAVDRLAQVALEARGASDANIQKIARSKGFRSRRIGGPPINQTRNIKNDYDSILACPMDEEQ